MPSEELKKNHGLIIPFLITRWKIDIQGTYMSGRGTHMDKRGSFKHILNVTQRDLDKNCRKLHLASSDWKEGVLFWIMISGQFSNQRVKNSRVYTQLQQAHIRGSFLVIHGFMMKVGGKPAWPVITYTLWRLLEGCSLLQFSDFKCTNCNYRGDSTILRPGKLYMTGDKPKLKLNYTRLKKKNGTMFFLHSTSII